MTEIIAATMTGAEMRSAREMLGLSPTWLAAWLKTDERNLERMERGSEPIHDKFAARMDELIEHTDILVNRLTETVRAELQSDDSEPILWTFKTDRDYEFWANRVARTVMKDVLPPRQSEETYETIRLKSMSLLMAGHSPTSVRDAIAATVSDGRADPAKIEGFPAVLPARWHRQLCARVTDRCPEAAIAYIE